jgi:hypothetical protein
MICDISSGDLLIDASRVRCGPTVILPTPAILTLQHSRSGNSITINHTQLSRGFEGLTISTCAPFVARGSSFTIRLSGDNLITATGLGSPSIDCSSNSHIILSESSGSITVAGGASAPRAAGPAILSSNQG